MATAKKTYGPGDTYYNVATYNRTELELVGLAEGHIVSVTEALGSPSERGIEVSVAEDASSPALVAELSRDQATALFDFLAEFLGIEFDEN